MGRDKVLGLSLAILLIGFAGAFCFRNDPIVESGLKVAREKILDNAIAQRLGPKPYASDTNTKAAKAASPSVTLQGIQSIEPDAANQTAQATEAERAAKPLDAAPVSIALDDSAPTPKSNDPFSSESPAANSITINNDAKPPVAEPTIRSQPQLVVQSDPVQSEAAPVSRPEAGIQQPATSTQNVAWRPIAAENIRDAKPVKPVGNGAGTSKTLIHHVRRGDSLIRLAQRYLGDGRRFREIYDANQDQMHSLDAPLRIGMPLKIPNSSSKPTPITGPTASKKRTNAHKTSMAAKTSRAHRVPVQNVSRIRETSLPTPSKRPPKTIKENETGQNSKKSSPLPKDKFIPVHKAPFLMRSFQSMAADGLANDLLSQRSSKNSDKFRSAHSSSGSQYEFFPRGESLNSTVDSEEMNGP